VSALPPYARLGVVVALVAVVLGGGIYVLFLRGDDSHPVVEAGSRFGNEDKGGGGGSLLDTLAPVLGASVRERPGSSDPAPPTADEVRRSPGDAVAGLMVVGFPGTAPKGTFFSRLAARPYGGVLLGRSNYVEPSQLAKLAARVQSVASDAGHAAPIVATQQEGGPDFSAFPNLVPEAQVAVGGRRPAAIRGGARFAGQQLKALGIGLNLAPNADVAVAGGPAEGRAYSGDTSRVAADVRAAVAGYAKAGIAAAPGPFPGDGGASQDPSNGPASVGLALEQLRVGDMAPFAAIAKGAGAAPAIQMSNAIYNAYDSVTPATILPDAVGELRGRLGFGGTIVSADLVATTATTGGSVADAAVEAVKAGVDMLLVPGGRPQQDEAYRAIVAAVAAGTIKPERIIASLGRIAKLRALTRDAREPVALG
jgi:beta-N-acetylhexosaminidase